MLLRAENAEERPFSKTKSWLEDQKASQKGRTFSLQQLKKIKNKKKNKKSDSHAVVPSTSKT